GRALPGSCAQGGHVAARPGAAARAVRTSGGIGSPAMARSCEVVAVGTELLLGQVVDTNSAWIGEQLAAAGIASHHQVKGGDNLGPLVCVLPLALGRGAR